MAPSGVPHPNSPHREKQDFKLTAPMPPDSRLEICRGENRLTEAAARLTRGLGDTLPQPVVEKFRNQETRSHGGSRLSVTEDTREVLRPPSGRRSVRRAQGSALQEERTRACARQRPHAHPRPRPRACPCTQTRPSARRGLQLPVQSRVAEGVSPVHLSQGRDSQAPDLLAGFLFFPCIAPSWLCMFSYVQALSRPVRSIMGLIRVTWGSYTLEQERLAGPQPRRSLGFSSDVFACVQNWASATASGCALRANREVVFCFVLCVCCLIFFPQGMAPSRPARNSRSGAMSPECSALSSLQPNPLCSRFVNNSALPA